MGGRVAGVGGGGDRNDVIFGGRRVVGGGGGGVVVWGRGFFVSGGFGFSSSLSLAFTHFRFFVGKEGTIR